MREQESAGRSGARPSATAGTGRGDSPFEIAWQQHLHENAPRPMLESVLGAASPAERQPLLRSLLVIELSCRRQRGENLSKDEYLSRFADDRAVVDEVFQQFETSSGTGSTTIFSQQVTRSGDSVSASVRYSGLSFLDEGGLGEVFRAEDEELRRAVAIKFVRPIHLSNQEARDRFRIEAEVTSRLCHPGVVPVYSIGEGWDGRPFYAMRLIEGQNLREAIAEFYKTDWEETGPGAHRLALHRLVRQLISASRTVAYAHHRGVLHLDIKPANIMLGKYGETLVVDWGLAQFIEYSSMLKVAGGRGLGGSRPLESGTSAKGAGTIGYMSPEQLPDSTEPVGTACDVYSLGATLYTLLTGTTAFQGTDLELLANQIRAGEFPKPREVKPCSRALEAICLKAMALRPRDRYANAEEFASDLERWLADEPVRVHRDSLPERIMRAARRHRKWSVAVASLAALILLAAVATSLVFAQLSRAADNARVGHLRTTAAFAARTYGYEIDRRWRILAEHAADAELHTLVLAATGQPMDSPAYTQLERWLLKQSSPYLSRGRAATWFVVDANGNQLARNPWNEKLMGQSFRRRSYFHGGPLDVTEKEAEKLPPIRQPHLSAVYESKGSHELKVAFTVPIWRSRNATGDVIGLLGMSIRLGDLVRLDPASASVVLADLRPDDLEGGVRKTGLILDHPRLDEARRASAKATGYGLLRLPTDLVAQLESLRQQRRQERSWGRAAGDEVLPTPLLIRDYRDPAAENPDAPCIAAFEPVFVGGRDADLQDTGWVVIIQDRANEKQVARPAPDSSGGD